MPNLVNDFEVRKETLRALGGNPDGLANIYEVDLEILKLIGSSEQGIPDAPVDGVQYARQNGEWTPVESGLDWNTIKQKLAEDGVESIKFIIGNEQVILTATEVKNLLNQTVLPDAPSDGKQYARQNGEWTPIQTPTVEKYMTITVDESNSGETIISPTVTGSIPNLNLQYRINNGEWSDFIVGTTADITAQPGDVVQFKGNNPNGLSSSYENYIKFSISGLCHLSGNVMSLIDGVGEILVIPCDFCFYHLFYNSKVKTISKDFLPATTLTHMCYHRMFENCESLTYAPELPATTLASYCYCGIFQYCYSLTQAPELPATTLAESCYQDMFECCSLTQAPELKALTMLPNCYNRMFAYTNLVQAPELPAITLAYGCYSMMFWGCHKLVKAPELPATTLYEDCYGYMFYECNNLVKAPELHATTLVNHCYGGMFNGCSKLNYVKCLATEGTINEDGTVPGALTDWLSGVSTTGTFEKPSEAVYVTDSQGGIPSGWTVKDIAEYTEAPKDGNQYARQDGTWVEVSKVKTTNNTTLKFWSGTQQEYDAIATKDANTLYVIS